MAKVLRSLANASVELKVRTRDVLVKCDLCNEVATYFPGLEETSIGHPKFCEEHYQQYLETRN